MTLNFRGKRGGRDNYYRNIEGDHDNRLGLVVSLVERVVTSLLPFVAGHDRKERTCVYPVEKHQTLLL